MPTNTQYRLPNSLRMGLLVAGLVGLLMGVLAWLQVERERAADLEEMDRRAYVLSHQMVYSVQAALQLPDREAAAALSSSLEGYPPLIGLAVYRPDGRLLAAGKDVQEFAADLNKVVARALKEQKDIIESIRTDQGRVYILASAIRAPDGQPQGVLVVVQDMSQVDKLVVSRRVRFGFWVGVVTLLLLTLVVAGAWLLYDRPLKRMMEWMRQLRGGDDAEPPPLEPPAARLANENGRLADSLRTARSAQRAQARAVAQTGQIWTRERLHAYMIDRLRGRRLLVLSNREPYLHELQDGKTRLRTPAGGLVTALDPVLRASGGVWIAHGAGNADRMTADERGRLAVPPDDPAYTLRRVWLSREEEHGYYHGFANEGLWPLCHLAHERPVFRASNWEHYLRANQRFAAIALEEVGADPAVVLVQDYHLALAPRLLKDARPDLTVGMFWHIPWPNPEAFRICPWRAELLRGLLGADLIGFHLQQHCNNFLDTADRMIEARLDWNRFTVESHDHVSRVRPFPIGVQPWSERRTPSGIHLARQIDELRDRYSLDHVRVAVGIDRIDYTKGLPERFRAVARFLERYPRYRGQFTLVQLSTPSRTYLRRYRDHLNELESLADTINWRFQTAAWKPIRFLVGDQDTATIHAFMRLAEINIVSSLHDGMNLVAKEFVAARSDLDGVLILSEFTGAARELSDALIVNPYDVEQFAETIQRALEMPSDERRERMTQMRRHVEEHNIYRWAADFLDTLTADPTSTSSTQEAT
ncbi:MAG: trehalose-6-phosphate synthase [Candidatus Competibacter sp.]|nr:trehalose-6-phosphate synthase [Candidatus Competibacter sp.]MDG4584189.1 trehalose-6-phosphate synthase [Candidatus Competibacter sp.]